MASSSAAEANADATEEEDWRLGVEAGAASSPATSGSAGREGSREGWRKLWRRAERGGESTESATEEMEAEDEEEDRLMRRGVGPRDCRPDRRTGVDAGVADAAEVDAEAAEEAAEEDDRVGVEAGELDGAPVATGAAEGVEASARTEEEDERDWRRAVLRLGVCTN